MKKIILTIFIFSSINAFSQSGWFKQSPLPTSNTLLSIQMVNQTTGFAVGTAGTIIKTTNCGFNWSLQVSGTLVILTSVNFINSSTGFTAGQNGIILKTTNGGTNWIISLSDPIITRFNSIFFPSVSNGYVVGESGMILKTTDSGSNWIVLTSPTPYNLKSVFFINNNTGYASGVSFIIKTTNGGNNWILEDPGILASYNSIYCIDENITYAVGSYSSTGSIILKTTDGGDTWNLQDPGQTYNNPLRSVIFKDANTGYAIGGSIVDKTTDGGNNWLAKNLNRYNLYSLSFLDPDTLYAVGIAGEVIKTTNSGNSWFSLFSGTIYEINSIFFVNDNTGFCAGNELCFLKTTNGGDYWNNIQVPYYYTPDFKSIFFINENTGYLTGYYGTIIKTTDSGGNWSYLTTQTYSTFYGLVFIDNDIGIAAGDTVFRTTNGGTDWLRQNLYGIISLHFPDHNIGYAVGYGGSIYKTTNSGVNWASQISGTTYDLKSVFFTDINTGYVSGDLFGYILKTTNGGIIWFPVALQASGTLYFVNSNTGYLVSGSGMIFKTNNAGLNWYSQNTPPSYGFNTVFFTRENTGYVAGNGGIIFKTTNGGEPIGIKAIQTSIPKVFSLYQNYPNPFNPSTKIKFSIPPSKGVRGMSVQLTIYDLLGRKIATLVNEQLKPGTYELEFDASNYASGVYFYRLEAGDFVDSKKMLMIK